MLLFFSLGLDFLKLVKLINYKTLFYDFSLLIFRLENLYVHLFLKFNCFILIILTHLNQSFLFKIVLNCLNFLQNQYY